MSSVHGSFCVVVVVAAVVVVDADVLSSVGWWRECARDFFSWRALSSVH